MRKSDNRLGWNAYTTWSLVFAAFVFAVPEPCPVQGADSVREQYTKQEYRIPMRDGVELFTAVYTPRDASNDKRYPILMMRTCYSVRPYGADRYRFALGPNRELQSEGYIFVYQDVRGCFMSDGKFVNVTPHRAVKKDAEDTDESSDTFDTIEWLLANVKHNNGRVGQWGISYPGFYAAAGMIDAHPALRAVSPQAPIADWWYDDFHHHGAFFLAHSFPFLAKFGQPRPEPTTLSPPRFNFGCADGFEFFLNIGPLHNVNEQYLRDRVVIWNHLVNHPNRDRFWQDRDLLPHLKKVAPAVLVVGGWYDAEDLYGPLQIYRRIESENPHVNNRLVMGPWAHGGWARTKGDHLGNIGFGANHSAFYQKRIESPFFRKYLKEDADPNLPEAYVFETGVNRWRQFDQWPPESMQKRRLYLVANGRLSFEKPVEKEGSFDQFESDPGSPVPYIEDTATGMTQKYMTDDQRFAARRPDVLVYQTEALTADMTLCGPLVANLHVATSQSDADWIVKLVDVFPADAEDSKFMQDGKHMGGYQMMVRSEVIRGRFRDDPASPKPFEPNQPAAVKLPLQDVLHTFREGHRIMVQIQSTWFPLVDRNPQKYVPNIFLANDADFVTATHRVYRWADQPTHLEVGVLDD